MRIPSSYPNPISWRPFNLTLIIFLQAISDNGGAEAKRYGDPCNYSEDCRETLYCSPYKGSCDCPNFLLNHLVQFFDEETRKCLTTVGKGCTLNQVEGLADFKCVPNATCTPQERGPRTLGICECNKGYTEDYRHLCVPSQMNEDHSSSIGSMGAISEEYPIGSRAMTNLNAMRSAQKLVDDGNMAIVVDQEVLERFKISGGARVDAKFINIVVLLTMSFMFLWAQEL